jgi:hypothetical protein
VVVYDWGDRVLVNKVTAGANAPENRWIFDLSLAEGSVTTQLYTQWRKWGLKWGLNDGAKRPAGPKAAPPAGN